VAALFASSGLEPEIEASFGDGPAGLRITSAVERAIKKHPHLARLERNDSPPLLPNVPPVRRLTNVDSTVARLRLPRRKRCSRFAAAPPRTTSPTSSSTSARGADR
jgi:hypothetical protein